MNENMLTYNHAFYELRDEVEPLYDTNEATAIAHEVLRHITGLNKTQRLMQKDQEFTPEQLDKYTNMKGGLVHGKPLQYVLGTALFMGHDYAVNEHVLIPRPETEELVQWVISDWNDKTNSTIFDIGTGSGCIPIELKLAMPNASITACDISVNALLMAVENANNLHSDVKFKELDFMQQALWQRLPKYDVIVSNPPYIPVSEKDMLHANVKDHEPAQALFVPSEDPLVFYRHIALFGKTHLNKKGCIYCELHVNYALQVKDLFMASGYRQMEIREDMHGNMRMLKVYGVE